jgi:protein-S-isoprenylcysteine O-methyltransferase Ste14
MMWFWITLDVIWLMVVLACFVLVVRAIREERASRREYEQDLDHYHRQM